MKERHARAYYISGNLNVYVPTASIDAYRAADYWNELNLLAE